MAIETTVVGSYPKPPEEGNPFVLRKTLHALEKGTATEADLRSAEDALVTEVLAEQEAAGIDIVTDGHARWDDILTPFARTLAGFEIGGLLRWFDNNVYYRRPICVGTVEWRGPSTVDAFRFAQAATSKPVKAVIPGAVTFARLSVDEYYGDHDAFVMALARVLAQEAFELEAAGARHIQIDEPALLQAPEDLAIAREALSEIAEQLQHAETTLATYFGDAKRIGSDLFELPTDYFALDLVSGPANRELLGDLPGNKGLQAGIVDARNTKLEPAEELVEMIQEVLTASRSAKLRVSPSAGLEFLPRERARAKLQRLVDAAKRVEA